MITRQWLEQNEWFVKMFMPEEWAKMTDQDKIDGLEEVKAEEEYEKFCDMGDDEVAEMAYWSSRAKREVTITCMGCKVVFKGQPEYGYCESCADKREHGMDYAF